jgi:hypothetical protein
MQRDLRDNPAGPDGQVRSPEEHRRINEMLAIAFKGEVGKAALDYLRSISIERACGPFVADGELRHLEGMRFIVGIISQRIAAHHKEQTRGNTPTAASPPAFTTPGTAIAPLAAAASRRGK